MVSVNYALKVPFHLFNLAAHVIAFASGLSFLDHVYSQDNSSDFQGNTVTPFLSIFILMATCVNWARSLWDILRDDEMALALGFPGALFGAILIGLASKQSKIGSVSSTLNNCAAWATIAGVTAVFLTLWQLVARVFFSGEAKPSSPPAAQQLESAQH